MKTKQQKRMVTVVMSIVLLLVTAMTAVWLVTANADAVRETTKMNVGGIEFDTGDFDYEEDYAAFVDMARVKEGESKLFDPERKEQKVRLDDGKSGLLLKTKRTGDAADGSAFMFANKMKGDFDIDFRVFSDETYVGKAALEAVKENDMNRGSAWNPNFNPFADLRTVSFTFTSVSDPTKSFTVYLDSHSTYNYMFPTARVAIDGEPFTSAGKKGYGIYYNDLQYSADDYANFTQLHGTSFTNVTNGSTERNPESFSNRLYFDAEKMCVYAYTRELIKYDWYGGWRYEEKKILIRDLASNKNGNDTVIPERWWGKFGTLSAADFAAGYTVKVTMEDVTANDTVLNAATSDATEAQTVYNGTVKVKKVGDAFDRTGKMIIYSVNGQDMRVNQGFKAPETFNYTFPTANTPYSGVAATGYRFEANEMNANAEGNSFSLDPAGFTNGNVFTMALAPRTTKYAPVIGTEWNFTQGYRNDGLSTKTYEYDPYSDVLELGVTFRSKTDPSKAFTVYLASRETMRNKVTVRVGIEGESYRNDGGLKGYGDNGLQAYAGSLSAGTFGNFANSNNDSYNSPTNPYSMIKFDASAMTVSTYTYGEAISRDLKTALNSYTKTLAASDFAGGYEVSVSVERMNRKENRGLATMYTINGNPANNTLDTGYTAGTDGVHVLDEGYDRKCIIDVIKFTGTNQITADEIGGYAGTPSYDGGNKYFDIGDKLSYAYDGNSIALPVKWGNLGAGEAISEVKYKHADDAAESSLAVTDGTASFVPTKPGKYTFTVSDGSKTHSAALDITTATPLTVSLADTVGEKTYVKSATFPLGAETDVKVDSCWQARVEITYKKDGAAFTADANATLEAGVYEITYAVTNSGNETASQTRTVVVDTAAPTVSWTAPTYLTAGGTLSATAITVQDDTDGAVQGVFKSVSFTPCGSSVAETPTVTDGTVALPNKDGLLTFVFAATDAAGNENEMTFENIKVYTKTAPTVALKDGIESITVATEGDAVAVSENDVTVSSAWNTTVTVTVTFNNEAIVSMPATVATGVYRITYTATDPFGTTGFVMRTVNVGVKDETAPTIDWTDVPAYWTANTQPDISGITATDGIDPDVSVKVESVSFTPCGGVARDLTYESGFTLPNEDGTLTLKVSATDASTNKSEKTFTVKVYTGTAPAISLKDGIEASGTAEEGALLTQIVRIDDVNATSAWHVDVTLACTYNSGEFTYDDTYKMKAGTYTVTYTATDEFGTKSTVTRTITVHEEEKLPPVLALKEGLQAVINAVEGETFAVSESDITVTSKWDYSVAIAITLDGKIHAYEDGQTLAIGIYEITYTVTDEHDKTAQITRKIIVVGKDTIAPELSWANKPAYVEIGKTLDISGITATDDRDESVSVVVVSVTFTPDGGEARAVDYVGGITAPNENGTLTIKVSATDTAGNKTEKPFEVLVVTEKPTTDEEEKPVPVPKKTGCGSNVAGSLGIETTLVVVAITVLCFKKRSKIKSK